MALKKNPKVYKDLGILCFKRFSASREIRRRSFASIKNALRETQGAKEQSRRREADVQSVRRTARRKAAFRAIP